VKPDNESIFNQYTIRVLDGQRDALAEHLKQAGIGSGIYYPVPLHLQECFAYLGYREGQFPESERACREVLSLPVFPELTPAQLGHVAQTILEFFGQ
jgi:dTDP-4-amino-4,6-dideoxygalactose transaminase